MTDWQTGNKTLSEIKYWVDFIRINEYKDSLFDQVYTKLKELDEDFRYIENIKEVLDETIASIELAAKSKQDERKSLVDNWYHYVYDLTKERFSKVLEELQEALLKTNIDKFRVVSYNEWEMILAGSSEFDYYHEVEIIFSDIEFVMLPMKEIRVDRIRRPNEEEIIELDNLIGWKIPEFVMCLDDDFRKRTFYIIAREISVNWDTVFYYERENLQEGERIADWVVKKK